MKGIIRDLGEMNIPLRPDSKPVKKWPYILNLRYKECIKEELEHMIDIGIIELFKESKWIGLMVVQDNKTGEIHICVDIWKLNDASLHDPFSIPFTEKYWKELKDKKSINLRMTFRAITK